MTVIGVLCLFSFSFYGVLLLAQGEKGEMMTNPETIKHRVISKVHLDPVSYSSCVTDLKTYMFLGR